MPSIQQSRPLVLGYQLAKSFISHKAGWGPSSLGAILKDIGKAHHHPVIFAEEYVQLKKDIADRYSVQAEQRFQQWVDELLGSDVEMISVGKNPQDSTADTLRDAVLMAIHAAEGAYIVYVSRSELRSNELKLYQASEYWQQASSYFYILDDVDSDHFSKASMRRTTRTAQYYTEMLADDTPLDMVLVPGGRFLMGSPADEPERRESEGPQHEVTVPPFFMARYPITQRQWRMVAALSKDAIDLKPDPSHFKGDQRPVENVSWHDATEFCHRLAQKTGRPYRLPSEAEWEYACRAGTTTPFYFGRTITPELANYNYAACYNDGPTGKGGGETTLVEQFGIANGFGLCEMHGNVLEWCEDHWHINYEGAPVNGSAWLDLEPSEDTKRVLRGGAWYSNPRHCRSASRYNDAAGTRGDGIGFRVVCVGPRILP